MIRPCRTGGCPHYVRSGMHNDHLEYGADGTFCWRCRQKQQREDKKSLKQLREADENA